MEIIVICSSCGAPCPSKWENGERVWLWENQKCEQCGAEAWAAHEPNRDWKTGREMDG